MLLAGAQPRPAAGLVRLRQAEGRAAAAVGGDGRRRGPGGRRHTAWHAGRGHTPPGRPQAAAAPWPATCCMRLAAQGAAHLVALRAGSHHACRLVGGGSGRHGALGAWAKLGAAPGASGGWRAWSTQSTGQWYRIGRAGGQSGEVSWERHAGRGRGLPAPFALLPASWIAWWHPQPRGSALSAQG